MATETKTLTFSTDNLTTSSCGKSTWSDHDNLEGTNCAPDTDTGDLGKQVIEPAKASIWGWGHTLVKRIAYIGRLRINTHRSTLEERPPGRLEQDISVHRVTSITQQRVSKGRAHYSRDLIITLDGGDIITLSLFGTEHADVTLNAKFTADNLGNLTAKEVK